MPRLTGKVALVTGGGSGFGEGIAKAFVKEGAKVIVADISTEGGKRVEKEIAESNSDPSNDSATYLELDVTKREAWERGLALAKEKYGRLDIVMNNAGTTYKKKPSTEVTEAEFDLIYNVNVKSVYWSVTVVMPYFVEQKRGVFLNTSSVAGMKVRPGQVFYGGTKGFLNTITQGLAAEYGPSGVRVNSICPLRGATGLLELFSGVPDSDEERARFAKTVPLGRMSFPDDIAAAACFLASDEAAFISGVCLPVDGGRLTV